MPECYTRFSADIVILAMFVGAAVGIICDRCFRGEWDED